MELFACANRVLGADATGVELLRNTADSDMQALYGQEPVDEDLRAYFPTRSGTRSTMMEGSNGSSVFEGEYEELLDGASPNTATFKGSESHAAPKQRRFVHQLDVSEADIARVMPRVISHRVRVRDGPRDEIMGSVVYSAVQDGVGSGDAATRGMVKEILVDILGEV